MVFQWFRERGPCSFPALILCSNWHFPRTAFGDILVVFLIHQLVLGVTDLNWKAEVGNASDVKNISILDPISASVVTIAMQKMECNIPVISCCNCRKKAQQNRLESRPCLPSSRTDLERLVQTNSQLMHLWISTFQKRIFLSLTESDHNLSNVWKVKSEWREKWLLFSSLYNTSQFWNKYNCHLFYRVFDLHGTHTTDNKITWQNETVFKTKVKFSDAFFMSHRIIQSIIRQYDIRHSLQNIFNFIFMLNWLTFCTYVTRWNRGFAVGTEWPLERPK